MKAIFHIGHHKTGTTSLQTFLAANGPLLLRAGILSPWVEAQGAVWAQSMALDGAGTEADLLPVNVREPHNALAFRMLAAARTEWRVPPYHRDLLNPAQMHHAIRSQIERFAPEAVVFCSEVMGHFGPDAPELIDQLATVIGAPDYVLHVTLRRPDDHLISWHGQALRFGAQLPALARFDGTGKDDTLHFDYRAVIEPWLDRLPGVEAHLRPYPETMAAGGSIPDFFEQSGLVCPDGTREARRMNQSIHRALLPLIRLARRDLERPAARTLANDLLVLDLPIDLPPADEIEFFGARTRAWMVERFTPIHDWLGEISGRDAFFDDFDDMARVRPIPETQALRLVLDQFTPELIDQFTNPAVRRVVTELKANFGVQAPD